MTPDELAARLKAHPFSVLREGLMQRVVLTVLPFAQRATPVRRGTLRRSETTRVESGGLRGFIGSNIVYAAFVHRRKPFFATAITDSRDAVVKVAEQAGDDYVASVV